MSEKVWTELISPWSFCCSMWDELRSFVFFPKLIIWNPSNTSFFNEFDTAPRILSYSSWRWDGSGETFGYTRDVVSSVFLLVKVTGLWLGLSPWGSPSLFSLQSSPTSSFSSYCLVNLVYLWSMVAFSSYSPFLNKFFMFEKVSTIDELPILSGCGVSIYSFLLVITVFWTWGTVIFFPWDLQSCLNDSMDSFMLETMSPSAI